MKCLTLNYCVTKKAVQCVGRRPLRVSFLGADFGPRLSKSSLQKNNFTFLAHIVWERFTAEQQAEEIERAWPGTGYVPSARF